ncbi:23S rRNA pseudouridine2604 synthase [Eubacterium uniforme]|uniref:Pseudouridine synthase n=1 Tax=Eubacterium uniforme TaxID=39495 RepID=A0A1T4VTY2_9FIRM|nr:pseudouridine synthase [Eubacterium uniforme]SKA68288.1 23S rRNA pseudouridine2604 synthase [Eubacterium uniforme]
MENRLIRLNKFFSEIGYCSRREADRLIDEGRVTIDDRDVLMGEKINLDDYESGKIKVTVDGKVISDTKMEQIVIAYNKPVGIECTNDLNNKDNIIKAIGFDKKLVYLGRLDKNSHGLILLTTDGELVNKIMRSRNNKEKEYVVHVSKPITDEFLEGMRSGVPILDTVTKECKVTKLTETSFNIILTQGLNRQIRRMCDYFGYTVSDLKRVRVCNIKLGKLKSGTYRVLSKEEVEELVK